MFEDKQQYEGNQPADTESEGFVPIDEEPVDYLADLQSRLSARDAEDAKPKVEEYRNSLPGPSPDPEYYDYTKMMNDNMQPKLGGEGVSPFPVEYYAKGHEPFDEWVMDANTGTYQPGNATTRVAIGAARDIAQGAFEYLLQGSDEDIMTLTEGVIAGSKIAAGVGVKALTDAFADNPDPASYENIIDDAIADAHDIAYNPPSLPEVAGGDPETAKGIVENIGRDLSILLGGVLGGNKAMPAQMFAVEVPKMMNWYRKTMEVIKKESIRERGVIAAEMIYSKVGEGGNLSTLLNDMGYGNELTEWLDSSVEGEEDQMALKNIVEGVLTSKMLQAFAVTAKGVYRYARAGGFAGPVTGTPAAQKGMVNLGLPKEASAARLGRKQKRAPEVGAQKNVRTVLKSEGKPDIVIGKQTKDDWKARVATNLTDDEAKKARTWYKDIEDAFRPIFGRKTDRFISAWLIANKNESPAGALGNALRVAEQIQTGTTGKKGGLNDEALRNLFQGIDIEGGIGQKLVDFIDSAMGRKTRQWMGDDPAGGSPAVVDVHTARDMGYIDEEYMNFLNKEGYDTSALELDFQGAPKEPAYESGANQLRELTDELNAEGYMGGDLTSSEVQAIGWVAQSKVTGAKAESPAQAIAQNIRRVSYEIAPGQGSPNYEKYGERFSALPPDEQFSVTKQTLESATKTVNDLAGVQVSDAVYGLGGWQKYTNSAVVNQMLASKETAEVASNAIGYLTQQEQVWVNKIKPMTRNPKGYGISITGDHLTDRKNVAALWDKILEKDGTDLIQGYQPITVDGKDGIMILIDKGGKKTRAAIDGEIRTMLDDIATTEESDILTHIGEAEITKSGTEGKYDEQAYLERIRELGREDIIPDLISNRGKLEKEFSKNLTEAEAKSKGKVTSAPSNQEAQ